MGQTLIALQTGGIDEGQGVGADRGYLRQQCYYCSLRHEIV